MKMYDVGPYRSYVMISESDFSMNLVLQFKLQEVYEKSCVILAAELNAVPRSLQCRIGLHRGCLTYGHAAWQVTAV